MLRLLRHLLKRPVLCGEGVLRHDGTGRRWVLPRGDDPGEIGRILGGLTTGRHHIHAATPVEHMVDTQPIALALINEALWPHGRHSTEPPPATLPSCTGRPYVITATPACP